MTKHNKHKQAANKKASKQTRERHTNKQTNKPTNKQTNKQTNTQASKQTYKQTNKQAIKQTSNALKFKRTKNYRRANKRANTSERVCTIIIKTIKTVQERQQL